MKDLAEIASVTIPELCDVCDGVFDVVFVTDNSESIDCPPGSSCRGGVANLCKPQDFACSIRETARQGLVAARNAFAPRPGRSRMGIVKFGSNATISVALTFNSKILDSHTKAGSYISKGSTALGEAVMAGVDALLKGKTFATYRADAHPIIILLTDGEQTDSLSPDIAADEVKNAFWGNFEYGVLFGLGAASADLSFLAPPAKGKYAMTPEKFYYKKVQDPSDYTAEIASVLGKICAKERASRISMAFAGALRNAGDESDGDDSGASSLSTAAVVGIAAGATAVVCALIICTVLAAVVAKMRTSRRAAGGDAQLKGGYSTSDLKRSMSRRGSRRNVAYSPILR